MENCLSAVTSLREHSTQDASVFMLGIAAARYLVANSLKHHEKAAAGPIPLECACPEMTF